MCVLYFEFNMHTITFFEVTMTFRIELHNQRPFFTASIIQLLQFSLCKITIIPFKQKHLETENNSHLIYPFKELQFPLGAANNPSYLLCTNEFNNTQ